MECDVMPESLFSQLLVDEICARLSKGEPLAVVCRDPHMPCDDTVRNWADKDEAVSRAIARAREAGHDSIAADCLAIADDARNDWMERQAAEGDEKAAQFNAEHVQRSKLRIDTRLKLLAKWDPKRWGERQQIEHTGKMTLESLVTSSYKGDSAGD